jgi:hypothetical protein
MGNHTTVVMVVDKLFDFFESNRLVLGLVLAKARFSQRMDYLLDINAGWY